MRFRKLRIAWSVGCSVVAVLFVALWVLSYRYFDEFWIPVTPELASGLLSGEGSVAIAIQERPPMYPGYYVVGYHRSKASNTNFRSKDSALGFRTSNGNGLRIVSAPHWFLAMLCGGLVAAAPSWLIWRFSLRTLLIATTLIAVVLRLIVWLR